LPQAARLALLRLFSVAASLCAFNASLRACFAVTHAAVGAGLA